MLSLSHSGQMDGSGKPWATRQTWPQSEHSNVLFVTSHLLERIFPDARQQAIRVSKLHHPR
jgi:hypothetical protein